MPVPINRNTDTSYGLFGAIRNFISPPGYVSRGPRGSIPAGQSTTGRPPMPGLPADYKQTELAAGAAAEAFRPGAGLPGQQQRSASPAERAYQQEASRVAQMTAQNPELQRYEAARKIAAAKGATPEQVQSAEDIGMRIWAEKYGKTLAPKVKPGQAGYETIQGVLNAGAMGDPMDLPFAPASVLGEKPIESIPTYAGASDLQPVGTPLPRTQFGTPANQSLVQMFNRYMQGQPQASTAPPINPAEATYVGATNVQPIAAGGDISLDAFSFNTPAEQRRSALFQQLLNSRATVGQ